MKLAIITDQHFGARKGADYIHKYFKKFYDNTFFPYLEKNKIDTIVDMGDTFDNRRNIDLATLEWSKKNYYDRLQAMGITCLLYTSPSPRDRTRSRMPSSA